MDAKDRKIIAHQLRAQAQVICKEDNDEEAACAALGACHALLKMVDVLIPTNLSESDFKDILAGYVGVLDEVWLFYQKCNKDMEEHEQKVCDKLFHEITNGKTQKDGKDYEYELKMEEYKEIQKAVLEKQKALEILETEYGAAQERFYQLQGSIEEIAQRKRELERWRESRTTFKLYKDQLCQLSEEFDYEKAKADDFRRQKIGTVFISTFARNNAGKKFGSGVFISDQGYILTCEHVVHDCDKIEAMVFNKFTEPARKWEHAQLVWSDEKLDAAIIKVREKQDVALPIADAGYRSKTGESIYMLGFPLGDNLSDEANLLSPSLSKGNVGSIQMKRGLERIDVYMEAKKGCSGGPVFSKETGSIIGILCGAQEHGGEQMNYVLPIRYLWENVIGEKHLGGDTSEI